MIAAAAAVYAFGVVVVLASLSGVVAPVRLVRTVRSLWRRPALLYFAVAVRLLLGALLIVAAPVSRFPNTFLVLGGIAVIAAVAIAAMGRAPIGRLLDWLAARPDWAVRGWCTFGATFGAFLVFAVS